jgi:Ca-activated chloride channel family protein
MASCCVRARFLLALLALCAVLLPSISCGGPRERPLLPRSQTWAELRTIRRAVTVKPPEEAERPPYPRERLVDGETVHVAPEGLAWLRRDGGATLLVRGPAQLTVRSFAVELTEGRIFVDTPAGFTTELTTPSGPLHLAHVRASIDVGKDATRVYVLAGEVRTGSGESAAARAGAGEELSMTGKGAAGKASVAPVLAWDDWTGGLATTDRAAEPSPFGVGTVGARRPGDQGSPHFPLAIQRLDVRVSIERDFAVTEVDEVFFNPSSEVVEGVYRFRTPEGATLHRFGVDRDGVIMWGRVKEKAAAAAQYQANVYQGSTEDPALLEWDAPGVYRARLYPIGPGEIRRVVVTYAEWLGRTGKKHERRLYVYPMAAEGAEESLPHIEELSATVDLGRAGARDVRAGMAAVRDGDTLMVREHDLVPRADLSVELFDDGLPVWRGYSAPHTVDVEALPPSERPEALRRARTEADYVLVPVPVDAEGPTPDGLDLAIVIDTSAATEIASLAVARAATAALLAHLGKADRVVVWAGDASLRPVVPARGKLLPVDEAARREIVAHLAAVERGGATDLGAMLGAAAAALDPARRGAVVYIGDGAPTVGEIGLADLQARLGKLPRPVRIFGLGVGDGADMAILKGLSRGAFAERIADANAAARAALRLLEVAERPARLGASIDLGPTVERIFPRDLGALVEGEGQVVVGRVAGASPTLLTVKTLAGEAKIPLKVSAIDDRGDLRRRWAEGRLAQMIDESTGRAAMVDLGSRYGIITPVTSLYVPTKREMTAEERSELERRRVVRVRHDSGHTKKRIRRSYNPTTGEEQNRVELEDEEKEATKVAENRPDNKEGGTGTRAKGEEGSMGNPNTRSTNSRYGVAEKPSVMALVDASGGAAAAPSASPTPAASAAADHFAKNDADKDMRARTITTEAPPPASPGAMPVAAAPARAGKLGGAHRAPDYGFFGPAGKDPAPKNAPDQGAATLTPPVTKSPEPEKPAPPTTPITDGWRGDPLAGALGGEDQTIAMIPDDSRLKASEIAFSGRPSYKVTPDEQRRDRPAAQRLAEGEATLAQRMQKGVSVSVHVPDVGHFAIRCGSAAFIPFEERITLWRERLARVMGNAQAVAGVYQRALGACEAPTWRERSKLLSMLLDAMPTIPGKVAVWRAMFGRLGASDALYRGILARVRTTAEIRALHDALGLRSIDPGVLAKILKEQKTPVARAQKLRALVAEWPDDFPLALKLLDALEDADDDPGARELAKQLRARPDADARLRTAVGELYLRLAARAASPEQKALDEAEARRAFGEIVEFSPEDPIARRRLGDLLRAHGWHAEAMRQYETLARLSPDEPGVALLIAAAADGMGKLEEAVKWTEKGGSAGAPDEGQSPARTARAFAATYLAWGRLEALAAGRAEEAKALAARLARVRSTERQASEALRGTRASLTWAHPEFHPTLWTNALGAGMPAPEGDVTLGVAAATVPARAGAWVEVRIEADEVDHAARLGAEAILTVVFDEGGDGEKIVKTRVTFSRAGAATKRFSLASGEVKEVRP